MVLGRRDTAGMLYQLGGRAEGFEVREIDRGFATSNSTCFSPDGRWLYFSDSHARQVWRYPYDTASGRVLGTVDFAGLLPAAERDANTDVLNGIAYDAAGDRLFVTGKRWPKVFEVRLKPRP